MGHRVKVTGEKTSAQCNGELRDRQNHAEMEWDALGDSEFCGAGDGQIEIRSHLVGLSSREQEA